MSGTVMPLIHPQVTRTSLSLADSRKRVLASFREWLNAAPSIVENYNLAQTTPFVRARVRAEFEKHKNVKDLAVIDRLIFKSRTEYEETINSWKQKTHVLRYFDDGVVYLQDPAPKGFLEKFYVGKR